MNKKTDLPETGSTGATPPQLERLRSGDLYRAIFRTESPELTVRGLAPQAVYLALQTYGLESGIELLDIVPKGHYQVFLDLHFWEKDSFSDTAFWHWVEVIEQEESLEGLERFVVAADEKLLALILAGNIHAIIGEEKAEAPPQDGYYTPDQGYTWVSILGDSENRGRLVAKLLAVVFRLQPALFYQLLNMAAGSTAAELEEEAFHEKTRRLSDEGLPDLDTTLRLNTQIDLDGLKALLKGGSKVSLPARAAFAPALYAGTLEPLTAVLKAVTQNDETRAELESELSLLVNAAILHFAGSMADTAAVEEQVERVRGTLNIGLERAVAELDVSAPELVQQIGLQPFYRLGVNELRMLRKRVREGLEKAVATNDPAVKLVAEGILSGPVPRRPAELKQDGSLQVKDNQTPEYLPFARLAEIRAAELLLSRAIP